MRIFLICLFLCFTLPVNLSATETRPSPEFYVDENRQLLAESKDEYYYKLKLENDPAYHAADQAYIEIIDFIRANAPVETNDIDNLVTEKYHDHPEIYALLGKFFSSFNGSEEYANKLLAELPEEEREASLKTFSYLVPTQDEIDYQKAEYYFLKAIDKSQITYDRGVIEMDLSTLYGDDSTELYSLDKMTAYLQRAADAGVSDAQFKLGVAYMDGINVEKDIEKGIKLIEQAADENDHRLALVSIQRIYNPEAQGPRPDNVKSIYYFEKSARLFNNSNAYGLIGKAYETGGYGIEKDEVKAFEYVKKCADISKSYFCAGILGEYYILGTGTEVDLKKSRAMYQKAIDMGGEQFEFMLEGLLE